MESLLCIADGAESSVQGVTILTLSPPIVESDTILGTLSKWPTTGPRASSGISSSLRFGISSKVTNQRTEGCSISMRDSLPITVVLLWGIYGYNFRVDENKNTLSDGVSCTHPSQASPFCAGKSLRRFD